MELSSEKKKRIEQMLVETIIAALEGEELKAEEYSNVSSFILEKVKTIKTQEELMIFLRELSARWRIFTKILVLESGEAKEKKDQETTENVVKLAEKGKIEEAISLAKAATGGSE